MAGTKDALVAGKTGSSREQAARKRNELPPRQRRRGPSGATGTDRETTMNANHNVRLAATIEQRLQTVNISEDRRRQVLHDVGNVELIADAIEWVCGWFKRPNVDVFAKPSPKD